MVRFGRFGDLLDSEIVKFVIILFCYKLLPLGSVTFGGSGGIHCPPVGGRAHRDPLPASRRQGPRARCSRAKEREGVRRVVRERRSTTRKSAAGPHVVGQTVSSSGDLVES